MGGDKAEERGRGFRTRGQSQIGVGLRVGSGDGWCGRNGGGKMETT